MPASLQPLDRLGHALAAADHVEAAFGRHFFAAFGHQRRLVGLGVAGDGEHVVGTRQFQIDRHGDRLDEHAQVAVLNVAAVLAQVDRDRVGPAEFGERRRPDGIGLVRLAGLADRGDVVDVDAQ